MVVYSSLSVSFGFGKIKIGLGKIRNCMVDEVGGNHCPLVGKVKLFERIAVYNLGKKRVLGKNLHQCCLHILGL